jgi:hypothetical protein
VGHVAEALKALKVETAKLEHPHARGRAPRPRRIDAGRVRPPDPRSNGLGRPLTDGADEVETLMEAGPTGMPSSPPLSPEPNAAPVLMPHSAGAARV